MRSVRFGQKQLGIEWTTIPPALYDGRRSYCDESLGEDLFINLLKNPLVNGVHPDPGVVEIPSSVLKGWNEVVEFYSLVMRRARRHSCRQESPHTTGGGGHIHISTRRWPEESEVVDDKTNALQAYVTDRPWISWAFNDPSDNITAVVGNSGNWYDRQPAIRDSYDNVEFRFFDSAENINEQIEHVAFALKLLSVRAPVRDARSRAPRMSLTQALKGWETTIQEFGLPWNLYRRYSKNIRTRFEFGPRYLN